MKYIFLLTAVVLIAVVTSGFLAVSYAKKTAVSDLVSPLSDEVLPSPVLSPTSFAAQPSGLAAAVSSALTGTSGTYGIVIKNLATGETYSQNAHVQFEAASLYKLWIMGEAFREIQSRQLDESEILSGDIPTLNQEFNISSESAELTTGSLSLSVSDALNEMITISHNYSALLLSQRLTLSNISAYLAQNGFTESALGEPPTTTPSDMASFLEKLYRGQLADADDTAAMLSLLKEQTFDAGLPKYLPAGTLVADKTGDLDDVYHDVGLVYSPQATYIIVVMSQSDSPPDALERIALVSQAVYNYFNP